MAYVTNSIWINFNLPQFNYICMQSNGTGADNIGIIYGDVKNLAHENLNAVDQLIDLNCSFIFWWY